MRIIEDIHSLSRTSVITKHPGLHDKFYSKTRPFEWGGFLNRPLNIKFAIEARTKELIRSDR